MSIEVGQRVRLKMTHRLAGTLAEIDSSRRELCGADLVSIVMDDHGPRPIPYFSDEIELETPCDCMWCAMRGRKRREGEGDIAEVERQRAKP